MREYLSWFMTASAFPENDAAFLLATYDAVQANELTATVWQEMLDAYEADLNCDFGLLLAEARRVAAALRIHAFTVELLLLLCCTRRAKAAYAEEGFSEELFLHTMLDLRYKLEECKAACRKYGVELHAWKMCWVTGGTNRSDGTVAAEAKRRGWLQVNDKGDELPHALCPSDPEVLAREIEA